MRSRMCRRVLLLASALTLTASFGGAAWAQAATGEAAGTADARLGAIEKQIQSLQSQLRQLKQRAVDRDRQLKAALRMPAAPRGVTPTQIVPVTPQIPAGYALVPAAPGAAPGSVVLAKVEPPQPHPKLPMGTFQVGAVTITLGGFIAAESVYRSRNQSGDIQSSLTSGIPEPNSQLYHEPEFRESARQTRLTAVLSANPDDVTQLQAYVSTDFSGAAPTSNANQSNSWVPRLREAYAAYKRSDWGFEVLAGQAWSLLTMTRVGLEPLNLNPPPTIDPTYVAGFAWARQPQIRLEKSFDHQRYWLAVSAENGQTTYGSTTIPSSLGTLNTANPGIGVDANTLSYTNNFAPDVIVKAVADYKRAHLEAFGLGRLFNDRVSQLGTGQNNTVFGGGGGGAALIRIIPNLLEFDASGMVGQGIGRYGTAQLPDATIGSQGQPVPLPEWMVNAGFVGHPTPRIDLYAFIGTEQVSARYFDADVKGKVTPYGYGNPLYSNAGCNEELSTLTCTANTSGVVMGTTGFWYRFEQGPYGTMQAGMQYSYVRRYVFQGIGATPKTDENMVLLSFRYFPFQ